MDIPASETVRQKNKMLNQRFQIQFIQGIQGYLRKYFFDKAFQQINGMKIRQISWNDFKGKVQKSSPYSAHIFWSIDYQVWKPPKSKKNLVKVEVKISPKSWAVEQKKKPELLMHEYGHYLIGRFVVTDEGCICALIFQKRVNQQYRQPLSFNFNEWCSSIFKDTLNDHLKIEKKYDEITDHRLNIPKQIEWQKLILKNIFDLNNHKPIDLGKNSISVETTDQSINSRDKSINSISEYCKAKEKLENSKKKAGFTIHRFPSMPKQKENRLLPNLKRNSKNIQF